MRMRFTILASLLLIGSVSLEAQSQTFGTYDLMKLQFVSSPAVSPDGKKVAYTTVTRSPLSDGKASSHISLHVLDVKSGTSKVYISDQKGIHSLAWTPDGKEVTFLASFGSKQQVHAISLTGGSYYKVTKAPHSVSSYHWNPKGGSIAFIASPRKSKSSKYKKMGFDAEVFEEDIAEKNLYVYNLKSGKTEQLTEGVSANTATWNPQGTMLASMIAPENLIDQFYMDKRVYTVNPKTKERKMVIENPGKMTDLAWSPDGAHIAIVCGSDKNDPVSGSIFVQNVQNPQPFNKLKNYVHKMELSATHVKWMDAKTIIYAADESVETTLSSHKIGAASRTVLLGAGKAVFSSFSISNGVVAFGGATPKHPNELYTFTTKKKVLTKRTNINSWLSDYKLAKQEEVIYKARDGMTVKGVLMYPLGYDKSKTYPLICYIHGGPESCVKNGWTTYYSMWGQTAAAEGYFVFMPNYRASSGRGVAYSKADYGDLGDEEFNDVLDGIDYLAKNKGVDKNRVGIGGGSYGGYFSAWGATKHSDHFKASCVFVGVSNQISKRNTTDIPNEDYLVHWGIWTNENVELIYDRSPVKYADNNKTPTLILHGKEDTRVHPSQSLELYRQLKMHGDAAVRLVWYPGEGHGNRQNPAKIDYSLRTMRWFNHYLKDGSDKNSIPDKELEYEIE